MTEKEKMKFHSSVSFKVSKHFSSARKLVLFDSKGARSQLFPSLFSAFLTLLPLGP